MDKIPQLRRRQSGSDFIHLRSLPSLRPSTKIGQMLWAREQIEAALAAGIKLKQIWEAASLDGLEMSYGQFRVYMSRLRRRRKQMVARAEQPPPAVSHKDLNLPVERSADPFNNLREQREKKKQSGFEYDAFSIDKNLIG